MNKASSLLALSLACFACERELPPPAAPAPAASASPPAQASSPPARVRPKLDQIPRLDFNRLAAELDLPLFWISDANKNGSIEPGELAVLWGIAPGAGPFLEHDDFTPAFDAAYISVVEAKARGLATDGLSEAEKKRRAVVLVELAQGMPTLVRSDFRGASAEDRALVAHIVTAAGVIERIFAKQYGSAGLEAELTADDRASRMLFYRNHGPFCVAPKTEKDPDCSALARHPVRVSGLYPASVQKDPKFCEKLEARKDHKALLDPFAVVVEKDGDLAAVPYSVAFKDDMTAVSRELAAAAQGMTSPSEAALKTYLEAASKAFLDNDWNPADEAWAKMSASNSRWYLRIGPDEVMADLCDQKGGFHVSFARINQESVAWQKKLDPIKNDMENKLAGLAGAPYKGRTVSFHLPDFIDIVVNAGDSRLYLGATTGQSLPNWGPVANEGRGRTVVMTNLYTDPDSRAMLRDKVESVVCKSSFEPEALDPSLGIMSIVLHEASHNLGPSAEYKVKGKTDTEIFGGQVASMLEELKAQTSALYLVDMLGDRGLIDKKRAALSHASDLLWAFGHISEGMYDARGTVKPYAQLSAIQVGAFLEAGAVLFRPDEVAANGRDKGCFAFVPEKVPGAIAALEKTVLQIKGKGDKAGAAKLRDKLVDGGGEWKRLREVITERWLRYPRANFVYSIDD